MKHILTTALLAMVCLMAFSKASAQAKMQATIPFDFTVGQKLLPSGPYSITSVQPGVIEVANRKQTARLFVPITAADYIGRRPNLLVFNKYGDQYFLSEVRGEIGGTALSLYPSKLEKSIRLQREALVHQQSTVIALK